MSNGIDCVYIAASTLDARLTRICVAHVRYFYPTIRIKLLVGGALAAWPGLGNLHVTGTYNALTCKPVTTVVSRYSFCTPKDF